MIKPTIGRVVWFHPRSVKPDDQPNAALIAYVHSDTLVNLAVFDSNGSLYPCSSVLLYQGDTERPAPGSQYCEWMPYQQGQAAKTEALEKQLAGKSGENPGKEPTPQQLEHPPVFASDDPQNRAATS